MFNLTFICPIISRSVHQARLEARDSDAKQAIARLQQANGELKAQLAPSSERLARAEQTIEQQRAEYTKIVSAERECRDLLARERERSAQEGRRATAFAEAKQLAEERLSGHEQTIAELQQRLQEQSGVQRAQAQRDRETREKFEREREQWTSSEKTLRGKISELERRIGEAQVCICYQMLSFVHNFEVCVLTERRNSPSMSRPSSHSKWSTSAPCRRHQ